MKKALALTLATLMLLTFLAACGGAPEPVAPAPVVTAEPAAPEPEPAAPPPDPTDEVIEIRVLNYFDLTNPGAMEELEVVWAAFEDANPNIKLVREDEFNEPFHYAVEAYAAAGTLPDVMFAWPSGRSTTLHTQGLLKDLTPLIERDGLKSFYIPSVMDPTAQVAGFQGIIPQGITATNMMIVNTEVLDEVGLTPAKTYSEMAAQVPVLRAAGYDTILMPNLDTWVMQSCLFSAVAGRYMGENWEQDILSGSRSFTDADFVASLEFIKQMYDDGVIPQSSLALDYGEAPGLFAQNTAAYYIDGDWRIGDFITDATTGDALIDPARQDKFIVTVFPEIDLPGVAIPARTNSVVLGTGWGLNANLEDGSAKLEAAWTLVKWLTGVEVQTFMLRTGGLSNPSRTDINFDALTLEPLQVALAGLGGEFDVITVVIDGAFEGPVYTPLNDGLQAIGLGIQTPQEVADLTQAAFEAWQ